MASTYLQCIVLREKRLNQKGYTLPDPTGLTHWKRKATESEDLLSQVRTSVETTGRSREVSGVMS